MKEKFVAAAAIAVLCLNCAVRTQVKAYGENGRRAEGERLVSLLPPSDAIAIMDSRRLFDDALPKLLVSYEPMLGGILEKLAEIQGNTGLDFRKFDQVAIGVSSKRISPAETDYVPVAIANGNVKATMSAISRLAAKGIYREEKFGDTTIYVFSGQAFTSKNTDSKVSAFVRKSLGSLAKNLAVSTLGADTLVLGAHSRVLETLESRSRATADVTSLLSYDKGSIVSFSARTSPTMLKMLPMSNNDFGETLDSIQFLSGSFEIASTGIGASLLAKIETPERTRTLQNTISALRIVARSVYGSSKRVDQQIYGRMIDEAKLTSKGTNLTLHLFLPREDLGILIGGTRDEK